MISRLGELNDKWDRTMLELEVWVWKLRLSLG